MFLCGHGGDEVLGGYRLSQDRFRLDLLHQLAWLPESWIGNPEIITPVAAEASGPLAGLGVSPGTAEGPVRVVEDGFGQLEPGEILVCEATDPSYAGYFFVAAGVVTDIGGAMGHGSIVAREVGIPCVVNTREATRRLQTGDRIRIDGGSGAIEILARASDG